MRFFLLCSAAILTFSCGSCDTEPVNTDPPFVEEPSFWDGTGWTAASHAKGYAPNYDLLFDPNVVHQMLITIDSATYAEMEADMVSKYGNFGTPQPPGPPSSSPDPMYAPVTVEFDGKKWLYVGMRYKGNSSLKSAWARGVHKLAFRLDFDEYEVEYPDILDQRFWGFKKMTFANGFEDPSVIRDRVAGDLFRAAGVPCARSSFMRVYVDNGSGPEYWGLYSMIEDPSDEMPGTQFYADGGNMYKPDGTGARFTTFDIAAFSKKTNEALADWSDVQAVYNALQASRTNAANWRLGLDSVFDTSGFLKYLAINNVLQNWDAYGKAPHNFYLYQDPGMGGRVRWVPWDLNHAFTDATSKQPPLSLSMSEVGTDWPMIRYLIDDPVYRAAYHTELQNFLDGAFAAATVTAEMQRLHDLIAPYVVGADGEQSGFTFTTASTFNSSLTGAPDALQDHVNQRHTEVSAYLASLP